MKKISIFVGILLITGFLTASSDFEVKKNLKVTKDMYYEKSVISFGGDIEIIGKVKQSVILIGGKLKLHGIVEEDVIGFAADVEISKEAIIKGDLIIVGGKLQRHTDSTVNGDYFYFRFDLKKIENTLIPILSEPRTQTFLKAMKIILWLIIALIVFLIVPQKINLAREIFEENILKTGLIGLMSLFSFIFLLFTFIILSFVLIGVPFLFALIIMYLIVFLIGRTVMFCYIGMKISQSLNLKKLTPALFILLGVIFYLILKFLPVMGNVFLFSKSESSAYILLR